MSSKRKPQALSRSLVLLAGISAFVIVSFWPTFTGIFELWQHNDHRHGTLVFPIAIFLIWRLKPQLDGIRLSSEPLGLLIIAVLLLIWALSRLAGIQVTEHAAALGLIPAAVFTVLGRELSSKLLFPLLFILTATPVGESLVPYLMIITADISTALLRLSGFPVLRDGQFISLPGGEFVVADVCSGIRYLTTGVMIALLYSYLTYERMVKRTLFVSLTAVTLIIANGVRAYLVMAIASATNLQYFGGRDHVYFGWVLFGIVIMLLMWFGGRFSDFQEAGHSERKNVEGTRFATPNAALIVVLGVIMLAATMNPFQQDLGNTTKYVMLAAIILGVVFSLGHRLKAGDAPAATAVASFDSRSLAVLVSAVAALLLLAVPQAVSIAEQEVPVDVQTRRLDALPGCGYRQDWQPGWMPAMRQPDVSQAVTLRCSGQSVSVYEAAYRSVLQGEELISGSNELLPERWDRYLRYSSTSLPTADGDTVSVVEARFESPQHHRIIWYWYDVDGNIATHTMHAKILQVIALIQRRPAGGRVILLETPVTADVETARQRLKSIALPLLSEADAP